MIMWVFVEGPTYVFKKPLTCSFLLYLLLVFRQLISTLIRDVYGVRMYAYYICNMSPGHTYMGLPKGR